MTTRSDDRGKVWRTKTIRYINRSKRGKGVYLTGVEEISRGVMVDEEVSIP